MNPAYIFAPERATQFMQLVMQLRFRIYRRQNTIILEEKTFNNWKIKYQLNYGNNRLRLRKSMAIKAEPRRELL